MYYWSALQRSGAAALVVAILWLIARWAVLPL